MTKKTDNTTIIIDTSGSVSLFEFENLFVELNQIQEAVKAEKNKKTLENQLNKSKKNKKINL